MICVEKGAKEYAWLLGLNVAEDNCSGEIKEVNVIENGYALSFDVQFKSRIVVRTYDEIIYSLFTPLLASSREENVSQDLPTLENVDEVANFTIDNTSETTESSSLSSSSSKTTTSIHASLSNTLWRALNSSDAYNGYQMISHLIQSRNVVSNSLAKKISSVYFQEMKDPNWHTAILAEYAIGCNFQSSDVKYFTWTMFEKFLGHSTTLMSYDAAGSLNLTRVTFLLDYLSQVLGKMIDNDELCNSFFGCKGNIRDALKQLSKYTGMYWNTYYNIVVGDHTQSIDPNIAVRVRRCLEAFGKACSRFSSMYCNVNGLQVCEIDCACMIKDNFLSQVGSVNQIQQMKILFVLTLDDDKDMSKLQTNLFELFDISSESSDIEL